MKEFLSSKYLHQLSYSRKYFHYPSIDLYERRESLYKFLHDLFRFIPISTKKIILMLPDFKSLLTLDDDGGE